MELGHKEIYGLFPFHTGMRERKKEMQLHDCNCQECFKEPGTHRLQMVNGPEILVCDTCLPKVEGEYVEIK